MAASLPLRTVSAFYGDLLAAAGLALAAIDLAAALAAGAPTRALLGDLTMVLAGLMARRVADLRGRRAPTIALAMLVAGGALGVAVTARWWVAAAVLLALAIASLDLPRRMRSASAGSLRELELALAAERARAADLVMQLREREGRDRTTSRRSLLRGALTRRLSAVEAIAQSIARDLSSALESDPRVTLPVAAQRSAERAARLAWLAGGGRAREQQTTLASVWPRVLELLQGRIESSHTVQGGFPPDLPAVAGTGETWVQILLALVENSLDAMPGGGVVRVSAQRGERDGLVRLTIADTGRGIAPEVLPHVLEPFYTSRAEQGAEGLGLAMVGSLVESLDGEIRLASTPGEGTRVDLEVPIAPVRASVEQPAPALEGTILAADDDREVRRGVVRTLASFGLEVVEAETGSSARTTFLADPGRFRAAVLDVVMPGVPVGEVVAAMRERRPGFPVLLVSGYDTMRLVDGVLALGGVRFLRKPFTRLEMYHALADLLASRDVEQPAS